MPARNGHLAILDARSMLKWGCVRRHRDYESEANACLRKLSVSQRDYFQALTEEHLPADVERWRWAQVNDPIPFPFPISPRVIERFTPWERGLWNFYKRWGLCYPIPPTVNHPHPMIRAWLSPRPAETRNYTGALVDLRVDLEAPLKSSVLPCLEEELRNTRRMFSMRLATRSIGSVCLLDGGRECLLRIPLSLSLEQARKQAHTILSAERRKLGITAGSVRERLKNDQRALRAWDLALEGKTLNAIAEALDCSKDQAWRAVRRSYLLIFAEPYPRKRRALQRGADFGKHLEHCLKCRTASSLCREGDRLLGVEVGTRSALYIPSWLQRQS